MAHQTLHAECILLPRSTVVKLQALGMPVKQDLVGD